MSVAAIISENQERRAELEAAYDPISGVGSPLERQPLEIEPGVVWHLPVQMFDLPVVQAISQASSLKRYYDSNPEHFEDVSWEAARDQFIKLRFGYDFEFWCATAARIKDKRGNTVRFILNRPQRLYLAELEAQRLAGRPVRQLILKHRQWGCTTFSYTYIAWHQIELFTGRDAWFVGLDKAGAGDVVERYDLIRQSYNERIAPLTIRNYGRTGDSKQLVERGCTLSIGTVERPNAPSGRPAMFVHLFEVGKWPSNPSVSAEKVVQNMDAMLVDEPGTASIIESTAQASTGTYFMQLCQKAMKRTTDGSEGAFRFLFVTWWQDPQYRREVDDPKTFVESWTEYERFLWDLGASIEHIAWYRRQGQKAGYILEPWRLMEEFPSTAQEAFQTGGRRIFPAPYVQAARKTCKEPLAVGDLIADGETGEAAFQNIRFEPNPRGRLSIWRMPDDTYGGLLRAPVLHRFCGAADVGGTWDGADYSDCLIKDRAPLLFGGMPEIAAEWHGHLDHDRFAWEAARLAYWYQQALLAVEVNSLLEDNETRYDPGLTVLDEIIGFYTNLYQRQVRDSVTQEFTQKVGFHMNGQTKDLAISALKRGLRELYEHVTEGKETVLGYVERSEQACTEMDIFLLHEDGSMGATSRSERSSKTKKDDRVIVRAIAKWLSDSMDPPRYIEHVPQRTRPVVPAGFN